MAQLAVLLLTVGLLERVNLQPPVAQRCARSESQLECACSCFHVLVRAARLAPGACVLHCSASGPARDSVNCPVPFVFLLPSPLVGRLPCMLVRLGCAAPQGAAAYS